MKLIFFVFFSLIISISIHDQDLNKKIKFKNPPGTIKVNDSLYIDTSPIDNIMYKEFIYNMDSFWNEDVHKYINTKNNFGLSWETLEKDIGFNNLKHIKRTSIIEVSNILTIGSTNQYLKDPTYQYFPVINITKEEAELYCKWRTDMVKLNWAILSKNKKERTKYPKDILYRLPTTKEFNISLNTFGFSKKKLKPYSKKAIFPYQSNHRKKHKKAIFFKHNISEYTFDSIPFGTNWKSEKNFNAFNDYTGFRCVCEIKN